jgi:hypothetical protein
MLRYGTLVFPLLLALLSSCGPAPEPVTPGGDPQPPGGATAEEPAAPAGGDAKEGPAAPAATEGASSAPAAAQSESESLARDLMKSGGRRIGYSATKKLFAYPSEQRRADGFRLDIVFAGEDGKQRDVMQVCDFAECAEKLDELVKEVGPKLTARLEGDGYAAIRGIGWPSGRDDLDVSSLGMKLRYTKGRLEGVHEGKPPVSFGQIKGELLAIFVVPDSKLLAVFVKPAGGAAVIQEFHVLKRP